MAGNVDSPPVPLLGAPGEHSADDLDFAKALGVRFQTKKMGRDEVWPTKWAGYQPVILSRVK